MANKTDGITDLTKVLIAASKKFSKTEYSKLTNVLFAMLHGVNYGYDQMDQRFLSDASDIHLLHHDEAFMKGLEKKLKKKNVKKYKNNVIKFSDYKQDTTNDGG
tara:strand:+ start:210 stop:521 length:312 start_codon:yes stop_codon:yes gene_type:complete